MHDGNWKAYDDDDVESSIRKGFQIWVTCSAISSHRSTFFPHWKFILSLPQKLWLQVFKRSSIERFCRDKNLTNDLKQRLVGTSVFLILTMNMRLTLLLLLHRQISMNKICTSSGLIEHFESLWFIH